MKKIDQYAMTAALTVAFAFVAAGPAALAAGPAAVNLGSAGNFAIVAKTGISTTGATSIVGNIGVSPTAASYLTGFGLTMDVSNTFSTSALVNGKVYAADYTPPTPTVMTAAVSDMQTAYVDGAGRTNPTATELGSGNIGGMTLAPGLYKWSTGVTIPTDVTLSGGANDVWIFQVAQNLSVGSGARIVLSGGAQASNVFWIVAGQTTIGTTAVVNGNILDQTMIALNTGATLNGRALAQAAVTLQANVVNGPSSAVVTPVVVPPAQTSTLNAVACTMDAMQCPDGSYVSRHGPTCAFAACPVVVPPTSNQPVSSNSNPDVNVGLQAQLNGLLTALHSLQAQAGQQASVSGQPVRTIGADLSMGMRSNNVTILQQFLISQNKGSAAQALANAGATGYFGALTRTALMEFQGSVGITPASGYFGVKTRAYLGALTQ